MVFFRPDSSQPKLVAILNSILVLMYRVEDGFSSSGFSPDEFRDFRISIRRLICFGKSLGFKVYDTEI